MTGSLSNREERINRFVIRKEIGEVRNLILDKMSYIKETLQLGNSQDKPNGLGEKKPKDFAKFASSLV